MSKVMIVTGGARGIGAAIATGAGAAGYAVAVNFTQAGSAAAAVVAAIEEAGGRAIAVKGDVSVEADVEHLFAETTRRLGVPDVVVNNAGMSIGGKVADQSLESFERILAVNTRGVFLCCRAAVRAMSTERGGKGGVIVNVSSISALYGGLPGDVIYAASKGAVDSFTLGLAKEVAKEGIRVCGMRPGLTLTDMMTADFGRDGAEKIGAKTVPMGRIGQPGEMAQAVLFLASDAASYLTGSFINCSGGREINVRSSMD